MKFPASILSIFLFFLAFVSISDALAIPQENTNILPEEDQQLDSGHLVKRGCVPSKPSDVCTDVPTVAFLVTKIQQHGKVGKRDSLFYSDLGGSGAIAKASDWYKKNVPKGRGSVAFDNIINEKWYKAQANALGGSMAKVDQFQKRLSQAFAEASQGTVYFFTKKQNKGTDMSENLAWGGWEYPALTRNTKVKEIVQVDPNEAGDKGHVIWKQGNGHSPKAPRG
ncbi:hypothetical protein BDW42DRAFT_172389 [Aspergillus taichungensis]|uniref:Uncharacterized protein n=1 Tax=Aspergillus taichungensis TaxID=482145 RepID=A0A2J5HR30_9EURO|nr:hypothetical protein BDW42DRAFT_172389 [Aspergillus taichungensis]